MIRQLSRSIREYKMYAILAPLMMVGEVAMEVLIPTLMAGFMDSGVKTSDMSFVLRQGGGLLLCAMASLCFGILSATFASRAAAGFAKNLRQDIFYKVQTYSFANIDKFSSSSIVTRLTTDVANLQNPHGHPLRYDADSVPHHGSAHQPPAVPHLLCGDAPAGLRPVFRHRKGAQNF